MYTLSDLIVTLNAYGERAAASLTQIQREALREMHARLVRLETQYEELLHVNEALLNSDDMARVSFDPDTDMVTIQGKTETRQLKLKRADPAVPISLVGSSIFAAYKAGSTNDEGEPRKQLKARMESLVEGFYYGAHRVQELGKELTGRRMKFTKVAIVRNKLIEHPEPGEFYSFGYSSNGPVVRPIQQAAREWIDEGLIPNVADFVTEMLSLLQ